MTSFDQWVHRTLSLRGLTLAQLGLDERATPEQIAQALGLEGGSDDTPPAWWDEAVRLKDEMSLKDLAEHLHVPVTTLTAELRRRGVRRRIKVEGEEEPEVVDDDASRPVPRPGSKDYNVDQYFHLLGMVPDSEVARLAGVSVRTIASYRARNSITGYAGPRRRPAPRGRRQSKVDDFSSLLGKVPDRVVADIAGMSLGAVRNYRIKHDIPAAGRMTREEIDRLLDEHRRGGASSGIAPVAGTAPQASWSPAVASWSAPAPARREPGSGRQPIAWRCRLHGDSEGFIVVAENLRAAVERAVAAAGDEARIASFEQLGQVLENI